MRKLSILYAWILLVLACGSTGDTSGTISKDAATATPQMALSVKELDFATPKLGSTDSLDLVILSTGDADLLVSAITLEEDDSTAEFALSKEGELSLEIPTGESQIIEVSLSPTDDQSDTGRITVFSNDPKTPSRSVELISRIKGEAALDTCVLLGDEPEPDLGVACADPEELDFDGISFGTSDSRLVRLRNAGSANYPLELTAVVLAGDTDKQELFSVELFRVAKEAEEDVVLPVFVAPEDALFIRLTFAADTAGTVPAEVLRIESSDDNDPQHDIPVSGVIDGCPDGFVDQNEDPEDGCEYPCTPSGEEICDGDDDDCDLTVDEDCNLDEDGYCTDTMTTVGTPSVCIAGGGDCDDNNAAIHPGVAETCDEADQNCNDIIDEGNNDCGGACPLSTALGTPCDGTDADLCLEGSFECDGLNQVECTDLTIGNVEVCNDIDDDCDEQTDEGCNSDGDAYCTASTNTLGTPPICPSGGGDCNDANSEVYPGALETCNEIDDDCDGTIDDGDNACFGVCELLETLGNACDGADADVCDHEGVWQCDGLNALACSDDSDDSVEICNELDDNCDGTTDEGTNSCLGACPLLEEPNIPCDSEDDIDTCFEDGRACFGLNETICVPAGIDADEDGASLGDISCDGDCDDTDPDVFPAHLEDCDLKDNDCDGFIDEGCPCEEFVFDGGGATTDWENELNWSPDGVPGHAILHCVTIPQGFTVTISSPPANPLESFTLHGTLTHPAADTDGVNLTVASDVLIGETGVIDAKAKGSPSQGGSGAGANGTSCHCGQGLTASGAGHGGNGGKGAAGLPAGGSSYGSLTEPTELGSGGGLRACSVNGTGGSGGGRVRVLVGGTLTVNGAIHTDGGDGTGCSTSGGSAGSVWITASAIESSSEDTAITANGGAGKDDSACHCNDSSIGGGGGAGGRIAIDGWAGILPDSLDLQARGGAPPGNGQRGAAGTVFLRAVDATGDVRIDNGGTSGGTTPFDQDGALTFANVTVSGAAVVEWSNSDVISIVDDLTVANDSTLSTALPLTPSTVTVNGILAASSGDTDGVTILANTVTVGESGVIDANAKGFAAPNGSGTGSNGTSCACESSLAASGGGYGGRGGTGTTGAPAGGDAYGNLFEPTDLGSGGGLRACSVSGTGGSGGGRVRLDIDTLVLNGTIRADGGSGTGCSTSGGSGGSIWISASEIETSSETATMQADGGAGANDTICHCNSTAVGGGGGSGGRIAVDSFAVAIPETIDIHTRGGSSGGTGGQRGAAGTVFLLAADAEKGDLTIDNGTSGGGITPLDGTDPWAFENLRIGADTTVETTWLDVASTFTLDGTLTHEAQSENGIRVVAGTMVIGATGIVDADAKGYVVGPGVGANGTSCSCGESLSGSGGGYGAQGGNGQNGVPTGGSLYGSVQGAPLDLGSGGGNRACSIGGAPGIGGGLVRIEVDGTFTVDGIVRASGSNAVGCSAGGGAGGSIWIIASTILSTDVPAIEALGGDGASDSACHCNDSSIGGGGGAGGRIAIFADVNDLPPSVATTGGNGAGGGGDGGIGPLFQFPGEDSLVTLLSPEHGGEGTATGTELSWDGWGDLGTGHFHVELDDDEHFDASDVHPETGEDQIATVNETLDTPGGPLTTTSWTTPELSDGTTYYWRVVVHNSGDGVIGGSRIFQFTTP